MVKLTGVLSKLARQRIMVVGDFMLDSYTIGKARRISPEAPVAVVHVEREEQRPGGAGNVVLNLISLGAEVISVGRIGNDSAGIALKNSLQKESADVRGLVEQQGYRTPIKNRILADFQQIVRVDHETISVISNELEESVLKSMPSLLKDVKVVAISDYGKGFLSHKLLSGIISCASEKNIPVISDPKGIDFTKYNGSTILKPNLGEAYAAANCSPGTPLEVVAEKIFGFANIEMLMITRSQEGISIFHRNGLRQDFAVKVREVKDVTGAGDTVLAMLSCALANDLPIDVATRLANVSAGMSIERFGCARISLSELARRLLEEDVANKVFDETHLFALQEALRGHPVEMLSVSGKQGLTPEIFSAIRKLKQNGNRELVVNVQDPSPDPDFISLLASLREVNFILLGNENLKI